MTNYVGSGCRTAALALLLLIGGGVQAGDAVPAPAAKPAFKCWHSGSGYCRSQLIRRDREQQFARMNKASPQQCAPTVAAATKKRRVGKLQVTTLAAAGS